ncbi:MULTISPECIES: FixH family protein [unclassified Kitasatospora]|uniref:copper resistance CopC/CopD family protein n=1 Tax=unclassified Kitasatospora TaxID=2633591 RepID=UPI00070C3C64|nr:MULTISPECIES: FixH family protein [unclassified Kitasatospora]KQV15514.1 ABC transporter [Kitasatospora sp. Root107]KRB63899.1 ABC transporter [Kitasatospora sp. Root187]
MWKRLGVLLTVVVTAGLLLIGSAGTASAHASLVSTDPVNNAVVATAPAAVTLTFSEGVSLSPDSVRVLGPDGASVDSGEPGHVDGKAATARVELRSGIANGTYTVAWRAVSEDSHPIGGAFTFSVGAPSATTVSAAALQDVKPDGVVAFAYGTGRTVAYAAFALLAGAAAFVLICWPAGAAVRSVQRLLMTGWVALLVSTVAVLLLRGPYERGTGIGQAFDLSLVRSTLDERIGTALSVRLLLLAAAGVFLSLLVGQLGQARPETLQDGNGEQDELRQLEQRAADRPLRDARLGLGVAGLVLAVALSATWAGADHASVGEQVWLALPAAMVHLLAMALWLGGLTTLLLALRNGVDVRTVERFSKLAFGAVGVLVLTGVYQAWRGLGSWGALVDTEYGRLLLLKTGAVVAMVGVAWFSRGWVARLRSGPLSVPAAGPVETGVSEPVAVGADPVRAAQLARQQAARDEATVRQERDGTPARAGLRRSVLVEAAVAVVILVVTTMLTNTPPGKVAEAVAGAPGSGPAGVPGAIPSTVPGKTVELKLPYDTGGRTPNAKGTATVAVNPAGVGLNSVQLTLTDTAGQPVEVPEVELAFTLPDRDLGPLPATLKAEGPGHWSGTGQLPLAGNWVVSVTVRSSDIDQVTEVKPLKIG